MKLNNRLNRISKLIEENSNIADIGCDHALLDIYLKLNKKNINIIASDNKEGPLDKAKENIKKYNLENKIKLLLTDGLDSIDKNTDTVVISGMGGLTINKIILNNKNKLKNIKNLILSPSSDIVLVRKMLTSIGYYIIDEYIEKDNNKYYVIIKSIKGKKKYNNKEYKYGPILLKRKDKLFLEYLNKEFLKKKIIYTKLPRYCFFKKALIRKEIRIMKKTIK